MSLKIVFYLFFFTPCLCRDVNLTSYDYHSRVGIPIAKALFTEEYAASKIIGGKPSSLGSLYYQAGLLITLRTGWPSVCSGALVSDRRVLTAAHCWWDGVNRGRVLTVVLGSLTLASGGTRVLTDDVVVHPRWKPEDVLFDIAVVRMTAVAFNNDIFYVSLPAADSSLAGLAATASGFGKTSDGQTISPSNSVLYQKELTIMTNAACQRSLKLDVHGSHVCTSGEGGVGTCDGDSGGPLVVNINMKRVLVGIVSFGAESACASGLPSVYTRVSAFLPWIQASM